MRRRSGRLNTQTNEPATSEASARRKPETDSQPKRTRSEGKQRATSPEPSSPAKKRRVDMSRNSSRKDKKRAKDLDNPRDCDELEIPPGSSQDHHEIKENSSHREEQEQLEEQERSSQDDMDMDSEENDQGQDDATANDPLAALAALQGFDRDAVEAAFGGPNGLRALQGLLSGSASLGFNESGSRLSSILQTLKSGYADDDGENSNNSEDEDEEDDDDEDDQSDEEPASSDSPASPREVLSALQELSEIFSVSTEETLAGFIHVHDYVKQLVRILKGDNIRHSDSADQPMEVGGMTKEEMIAFGIDPASYGSSSSNLEDEELNVQMMLLAARCLANLMEALPSSSRQVVSGGAVPILLSKLRDIQWIDLAEQTLSTLEKISEEIPASIVREGGLEAILNFLDFFSIHVQRTAVTAAANCCRLLSTDTFSQIAQVLPNIRQILAYSDAKIVEQASVGLTRIVENYRFSKDKLEKVLSLEMIQRVLGILNPDTTLITPSTYYSILKMLSTACCTSSVIGRILLENDIGEVMYHLLMGISPTWRLEDGVKTQVINQVKDREGLIMQNMGSRSKEVIVETVGLVSELLPDLPSVGIFDSKAYLSKPQADNKDEEVTEEASTSDVNEPAEASDADAEMDFTPATTKSPTSIISGRMQHLEIQSVAESENEEPEELKEALARFYKLLLPTLIDVYQASVNFGVKSKCLKGLLKIVNFSELSTLQEILEEVSMAAFLTTILASRDQPSVLVPALQLVELLLQRIPETYHYYFRREGVMHEVERVSNLTLSSEEEEKHEIKVIPSSSSGIARSLHQSSSDNSGTWDIVIGRARHVKELWVSGNSEPATRARKELERLEKLAKCFADNSQTAEEYEQLVVQVTELFVDEAGALSGFELMESGLVDGLLQFATSPDYTVALADRQTILATSLLPQFHQGQPSNAFLVLVRRLQENLSRLEQFEVSVASASSDGDPKRSSSMLSRQLRLRLVAEADSDIPSSCSNMFVSIHAIATFQAFNDYLRPRILAASTSSSSKSRSAPDAADSGLSNLLAALVNASNGGTPTGSRISSSLGAGLSTSADIENSAPGSPIPKTPKRSRRSKVENPEVTTPMTESGNVSGANEADNDLEEDIAENDLFNSDVNTPSRDTDKTVTLEDGSRVGTPLGRTGTPAESSSTSKLAGSFAAAVKSVPTDFHIQFYVGGTPVGLDATIYGSIYRYSNTEKKSIWHDTHSVTFKRVKGPSPTIQKNEATVVEHVREIPQSVASSQPQSQILSLLRVLHDMNSEYSDTPEAQNGILDVLPETAFINNRLTAKLSRQLDEPMIVASSCLPEWSTDLPKVFPFIFPFETRMVFLQSTAFGYSRTLKRWLGNSSQTQSRNDSRRDGSLSFFGLVPRQKVRISRERIMESALKVFERYGCTQASLEVEFFNEVGSGLGPTLEFYALVSREFALKELGMWRTSSSDTPYEFSKLGLFPRPLNLTSNSSSGEKKILQWFRLLGQLVAKSMMDSRIIDVHLNRAFMKLVLDYDIPMTSSSVKSVDDSIGRSLQGLEEYLSLKAQIENDPSLPQSEREALVSAITVNGVSVSSMFLDFVLPGTDIPLKENGSEIAVTIWNLQEYVDLVIDWTLRHGVQHQVAQFKEGFSAVFPIGNLAPLTAAEMVTLTGSKDEDWSLETLLNTTKADHGYTLDSAPVKSILYVMSELSPTERREFLSFITGSPRLPVGGFSSLTPGLTIVRKDGGDSTLPSVMTCVNYIKLPNYSSREVVKEQVLKAMREGAGGFHLS